ncbi:MAG: hypothetical protein IJ038_02750 [Clostridia bacterium]|nr:hypothetical protein [Clostridia bacterium]
MKKTIKVLALVMTALMLCMALASCAKKLSGKYSADILGTGTTLTFDGSDVKLGITVTLLGEVASVDGTYTIEDDKITFDFVDEENVENEKAKAVLADFTGTLDFEEGDDYIKIGGVKYEKVD